MLKSGKSSCATTHVMTPGSAETLPTSSTLRSRNGDRRTFYSVQYLRAAAALLVVTYHAVHKQGQLAGTTQSWDVGQCGVDLFFIISGFIMCNTAESRRLTATSFLKARFIRIMPLYWTLSLAALAIFLVRPDLVNSSGGETTILNSFTLYPVGKKLLVQNGWTLSYEFWFYLIFAVTIHLGNMLRPLAVSSIIVALVAIGQFASFQSPAAIFATSPMLLEFVMGVLAYTYMTLRPRSSFPYPLLALVGVVWLCLFGERGLSGIRPIDFGVPMLLVFVGVVRCESTLYKFRTTMPGRLAKALGDSSYSLYLCHPFSLVATAVLIKRIGLSNYPVASVATLVALAALTGFVCYRLVETRLTQFSKPSREPVPIVG